MKNPVFVENWALTKERWLAFWAGDYIERPVIQLAVPKRSRRVDAALEAEHMDPVKRHGDYRHICRYGLYSMENTRYFAEALPLMTPGSSVGHALYFGCEPVYNLDTMWCRPLSNGPDGVPELHFSRENEWYRWFHEASVYFSEQSGGRYFTVPNFGNYAADTLSLIRGSEQLMFDLVERPDWFRAQERMITDVLLDAYEERYRDVEKNPVEGYLNEAWMWAPKRAWGIHCDISSMVSTEMVKDLLWESQHRIAELADYAYYHVDGPGVLRHLDLILQEEKIQAIQWLPGDGRNHPLQWLDVYRRIQEKGRSVQIFVPYDEVLPLLPEIRPGGVCLMVLGCPDETAAEALIEAVERFYRGR